MMETMNSLYVDRVHLEGQLPEDSYLTQNPAIAQLEREDLELKKKVTLMWLVHVILKSIQKLRLWKRMFYILKKRLMQV